MPWQTVAQAANLADFQAAGQNPALQDLPKATRLRLTVQFPTWAPIGVIGNIAGAEWWAQQFAPHGITVTDVSGDWYNINVDAVVDPLPIWFLIAIIAAALAAVAFLIISIKLDAEQLTQVGTSILTWGTVALIGAGAFLAYKLVKG